jgi:alkylhydroperoxidase/carboxymuconolactone decarboxylase family protein YurZ
MDKNIFKNYLVSLQLSAEKDRLRIISLLSAVIALCRDDITRTMYNYLKEIDFNHTAIYETILQSYLFLGFPRMIEAALTHSEIFKDLPPDSGVNFDRVSDEESEKWFNNGVNLCRQVYGKNYERLKEKFISVSPEMFRWMVIEGYGKVLTRPGLTSIERELAEVAALIIDKRERQLTSHIIGSLNVGASIEQLRQVNEDIKPLSGDEAFQITGQLIDNIIVKYR